MTREQSIAMRKNFYIPPSYTLASKHSNSGTVLSLAPFVSLCSSPLNHVGVLRPYYQQRKVQSTSTASTSRSSSSLSTAILHRADDNAFATPPSTASSSDQFITSNPFELPCDKHVLSSIDKVRIRRSCMSSHLRRKNATDLFIARTHLIYSSLFSRLNCPRTFHNLPLIHFRPEKNQKRQLRHDLAAQIRMLQQPLLIQQSRWLLATRMPLPEENIDYPMMWVTWYCSACTSSIYESSMETLVRASSKHWRRE